MLTHESLHAVLVEGVHLFKELVLFSLKVCPVPEVRREQSQNVVLRLFLQLTDRRALNSRFSLQVLHLQIATAWSRPGLAPLPLSHSPPPPLHTDEEEEEEEEAGDEKKKKEEEGRGG